MLENRFDADFASVPEFARFYRSLGMQAVPAKEPRESREWKRPALVTWREFEKELAPDDVFAQWYGGRGEHVGRSNIGIITGRASGGIFIVDLDIHAKSEAASWWDYILSCEQRAGELETARQTTGGGGKQLLFRAPAGWSPPTAKTPIGVDIRGEGGFAVLPPSRHASGQTYAWDADLAPWEVGIAVAPAWLCAEIDALINQYGGHRGAAAGVSIAHGPTVRTATPAQSMNAFGALIDGREDYMTRLVWARVVDERRQCPIKPGSKEVDQMAETLFVVYERNVRSRLTDPNRSNEELLEAEGRGKTLLRQKMHAAFAQWEGKVALHANEDRPLSDATAPISLLSKGIDIAHAEQVPALPANDEGVSLQSAWARELMRGRQGALLANAQNLSVVMRNHCSWLGLLAFDQFNERVVLTKMPPWNDAGARWEDRPINDEDVFGAISWLNRNGFPTISNSALVSAAIDATARANPFHPVKSYLNALQWDGNPRLDNWLTDYCCATPSETESPFYSAVGAKFLVGAVARVFKPGCKHDDMLILEGPQGSGKSTALRVLCGDRYFGDALPPMSSKDACAYTRGKWFIELAELAAMAKNEVEQIKAFLSRSEECFRPAYGRYEVRYQRQCVFAGSTNRADFLRDETGNRRFWPVRVGKIDVSALARDRDQLWAEAVVRFREGATWWLSGALVDVASEIQRERVAEDAWTGLVANRLASRMPCSVIDLARVIGIPHERVGRAERNRIDAILRLSGWVRDGRFRTRDHNRDAARYVPPEHQRDDFG